MKWVPQHVWPRMTSTKCTCRSWRSHFRDALNSCIHVTSSKGVLSICLYISTTLRQQWKGQTPNASNVISTMTFPRGNAVLPLTLSQCTLAGPVYTGMPLECYWLTQCTLGYHWATQRMLAGYTGTPLEKLSWNRPHWNATGETATFAAYTGTPLEGLWHPTQAPTHIVKHAE